MMLAGEVPVQAEPWKSEQGQSYDLYLDWTGYSFSSLIVKRDCLLTGSEA